MHIKTQLSAKDYVEVSMHLLYRKRSTIIITIIGVVLLLLNLALMLITDDNMYTGFIMAVFILIFSPLVCFWSAKRVYKANKRVSELTEYRFDNANLFIKGETYESRVEWSNIPKVTVTKKWVILWINKVQGYIIPRRDFWDGELHDLKSILNNKNIPNNI